MIRAAGSRQVLMFSMSETASSAKKTQDPDAILESFLSPVGPGSGGRAGADKDNADQRWVDALKINAKKIARIEIKWRRGSSPYEPIEGLVFDVPDYDPEANEEKEPRNGDVGQWARKIADALWYRAWMWATENHTKYIDAQIIGSEWSVAKSRHVEIKGCKVAAQMEIATGHSTALDIAEGGDPQLAIIVFLVGAMERKEERDRKRDEVTDKVFEAAGRSIDRSMSIADKAIARMDKMSESELEDRKESRNLLAKIVQIDAISKNIGQAITDLKPGLNDLFSSWAQPSTTGKSYADLAGSLLASITAEQVAAFQKGGLGDVIDDMQKILGKLKTDIPDSEKEGVVQAFARIIHSKGKLLESILTSKQRQLAVAILRKAGLAH